MSKEKGFTIIEIALVVVVLGLLGYIGYAAWQTVNKKTDTQTTQVTSQKEEKVVVADPNAGYLVVKEWGLRFKVPAGLEDVRYVIHDDTLAFYAKPSDSSVEYTSGYDKFEEGHWTYATGVLYRSDSSTKPFAFDETRTGKKVGNYYYYTNWAFSNLSTGAGCKGLYGVSDSDCQTENAAFQLVNQGDTALLNTIELAQ